MPESLVYQRKQILINLPVRHIYERLEADSIKTQIARLHGAPQKMKNFFILAKYNACFLFFASNNYFADRTSWTLH